MSTILQMQVENAEDFKNEIIRGVVSQIKDLGIYNKPQEEKQDDLISRVETATVLNISLVKLWAITKEGLLPRLKIGKKVLYKRMDIQEFINSQNKF
jgi:hypothetical protein